VAAPYFTGLDRVRPPTSVLLPLDEIFIWKELPMTATAAGHRADLRAAGRRCGTVRRRASSRTGQAFPDLLRRGGRSAARVSETGERADFDVRRRRVHLRSSEGRRPAERLRGPVAT